MAWMLLVAKSIYDEIINAFQIVELFFWDCLHVCDKGEVANAEADNWQFSVHHAYRNNLDAINVDGNMRLHLYQVDGRNARIALVLRREAIWDAFHEMIGTELFGIDIDVAKDAVGTEIVKSSNMVIMLMSDEDSVELLEVNLQHLFAEIRAAVNKDVLSVNFHHC